MAEEDQRNEQQHLISLLLSTPESIPEEMSMLLSNYAGIPAGSQTDHIIQIRDHAFKSHPYPCLGRFRFLQLDLSKHPLYESTILKELRTQPGHDQPPHLFLDLGCCLAQDLRKLAYDGVPHECLYGADLRPEFVEAGYELFRDENRLPRSHFIVPADILDKSPTNKLSVLDGRVTILDASAFFHLFELKLQKEIALRCLRLLNPKKKKVLICGSQMGNVNAGEFARRSGALRWRHDEDSWREMWEEAARSSEWKDRIESIHVESVLHERDFAAGKDGIREGKEEDEAQDNSRRFRTVGEGFRWMVFSIFIEFK